MRNPDYITKGARAKIAAAMRERILRDRYDVANDITDALADLRHLCDLLQLDFADLDRQAHDHYRAETTRAACAEFWPEVRA